ncbi:MAG: DUF1304 domain-containing protein [Parvularculaceae bacterium]|jgi:putative membrane protein|nr:DUF1304 domain-containing protein [Parvularculaceae bacterium]
MAIIARLFMAALAGLHAYFGWLEMFRWTAPRTIEAFGLTPEFAEASRILAVNQGAYNWIFAAGMLWAAFAPLRLARPLGFFFSGAALAAGLFGGATGPDSIFLYQALPGALALAAVYVSQRPKFR